MATSVATPNFSASTSSFRASQATASMSPSYSDNPITQLPRVDFNFEDLRQRMAAFTVKFDAFIERGRKRVLEERNEFRGRLSELSGTYRIAITPATRRLCAGYLRINRPTDLWCRGSKPDAAVDSNPFVYIAIARDAPDT